MAELDHNNDQAQALSKILDFLQKENKTKVFVLRGSAGTGKTTLIKTLLDNIPDHIREIQLGALTNKAVKVLTHATGHHAITIHRMLYRIEEVENEKKLKLIKRSIKPDTPTLIVLDEASMIGDKLHTKNELFEGTPILTDILSYIFSGHALNKLVIVGDPCQLPPVGYESNEPSPALDIDYLLNTKKITVNSFELKNVIRQAEDSYILKGATAIRDYLLYQGNPEIKWQARILENPTEAIKRYVNEFDQNVDEKVVILAWTNADVNWWNLALRSRLGLDRYHLMAGTKVLIDRNWSDGHHALIKGEACIIQEVDQQIHEFAGLKFINVVLESCDMLGNQYICKAKVLLEHLFSPNGTLSTDQEKHLRHEAYRTNSKYRENERPWNDPYVGALRLRYGYALTCHKAQGSEFRNVILHPYYPKEDRRWLYTAITRAKQELYMYKRA